MTNKLDILELLDAIRPDGRCDDCLSDELDIKPRQTVNIICRPLHENGETTRLKAVCSRCGKVKLVNTLAAANDYQRVARRAARRVAAPAAPAPGAAANHEVDVEKLRTDLVRIVRAFWQQSGAGDPPRSLSASILELRAIGAIPQLQASLMMTLCGIRNVYVYEGISLGRHEQAIVVHAAEAISEWWTSRI